MKLCLVIRDIDMQHADIERAMVAETEGHPTTQHHVLPAAFQQHLIQTSQISDFVHA
jgi:hypothetical protein